MPAKVPQDHKTKQPDVFTFTHDGKIYTLPPGETAAEKMPGRFLRDAAMDGEEGQMRLAFAMLEAVVADGETLDALYAKPSTEMLEVIGDWMSFKAPEGASVGESARSSD